MSEDLDDACLVGRVQAGYVDAFELLYIRHRDRVFRVALRQLGDPHDAAEAAQEALIDAWRVVSKGSARVP